MLRRESSAGGTISYAHCTPRARPWRGPGHDCRFPSVSFLMLYATRECPSPGSSTGRAGLFWKWSVGRDADGSRRIPVRMEGEWRAGVSWQVGKCDVGRHPRLGRRRDARRLGLAYVVGASRRDGDICTMPVDAKPSGASTELRHFSFTARTTTSTFHRVAILHNLICPIEASHLPLLTHTSYLTA